jgi:hypothetical protein
MLYGLPIIDGFLFGPYAVEDAEEEDAEEDVEEDAEVGDADAEVVEMDDFCLTDVDDLLEEALLFEDVVVDGIALVWVSAAVTVTDEDDDDETVVADRTDGAGLFLSIEALLCQYA